MLRARNFTFKSPRSIALLLFLGLVVAYHANWTEMVEGDTFATISMPYHFMRTGELSFDPERFPSMFKWRSKSPLYERDDYSVRRWTDHIGENRASEWRQSGHLTFNGPRYFVVESPLRRVYVNTFGPMPAMFLLPIAALISVVDDKVADKLWLKLAIAKVTASMLIAGCAVLIFFIALRYLTKGRALLVALAYGLGSCVWAISSQTIWQQTINQFLLLLGAWFFLGAIHRPGIAALTGFILGAATASRVTAIAMFACVFGYLVLYQRRSCLWFVLGAWPVPALIGIYNWYYFGSPLTFAQELVGHMLATEKTGSPELWQTPLWKGLLGLLVSPSRGLLVFSPFFALTFWGIVRIWRDTRFHAQRPLTIATLLMMGIQCRWFDWWGGWAYGYRPWLDVMPFLALFLTPVIPTITATRVRQAACALALGWGVFVQALGAFSYDRSWNERELFVVRLPNRSEPLAFLEQDTARAIAQDNDGTYIGGTRCNIDTPFCRFRLWSLKDNLVLYQFTHFSETRARRTASGWRYLRWSR